MNRFRTSLFKSLYASFLGIIMLLFLVQVQIFGRQLSDSEGSTLPQPHLQSGHAIYADLDTAKQVVYVLLGNSFWSYDLTTARWKALAEYSSLPEPMRKLGFAYNHTNNKFLLWSDGIGTVYEIIPDDFSIHRIDRSFPHKNQFGHFPFFYEGELHAFGGYGFWKYKNYITRFNTEINEWSVVSTALEAPPAPSLAPHTGIFYKETSDLYIYGGRKIKDNRTDDKHAKRVTDSGVWKYSFPHAKWKRVGQISENAGAFFSPTQLRQLGRTNSVSSSFYSESSNLWYIPFYKHNTSSEVFFVKPFSLNNHKYFDLIELPLGDGKEFLISNYFFNNKKDEVVLVGVKLLTNTKQLPVQIKTIPEDSLLAQIQMQSAGFSYWYIGGALLFISALGIAFWYSKNSLQSQSDDENLSPQKLASTLELSTFEIKLLTTLFENSSFLETHELEQIIWPEIENYDYRRKLRNDTYKSLNTKFRAAYPRKGPLVVRKKDPKDSRRFLYGLNEKLNLVHEE